MRPVCESPAVPTVIADGAKQVGMKLLEYFGYINPCGFIDKGVTSMEKELNKTIDMAILKDELRAEINNIFSQQQ